MGFQKSSDWAWSISTLSTHFKFIRHPYIVLISCNGCPEKNLITFFPVGQNKQKLDSSSQVDPLYNNTSTVPFCDVWLKGVNRKIKKERKERNRVWESMLYVSFLRCISWIHPSHLLLAIMKSTLYDIKFIMHLIVKTTPQPSSPRQWLQ